MAGMTKAERTELRSEFAGYVYVIAFSDGTVKVGRSRNATNRLKDHAGMARNFGLTLTNQWISPEHETWIENERELMRLARELGGTPTNPGSEEYHRGVSFEALVAAASGLSFTASAPADAPRAAGSPGESVLPNLDRLPQWLSAEVDRFAVLIADGCCTDDEAIARVTEWLISRDRQIGRRLVEQRIGRHLNTAIRKLLAREMAQLGLASLPEPPEPPEPEPPVPAGQVIELARHLVRAAA